VTARNEALQNAEFVIRAERLLAQAFQAEEESALAQGALDDLAREYDLPADADADSADTAADGPVFVDLRTVVERDVVWIDRPFLPAGELVTNNADGDTGKGLVAVHWAARISRGEFGDPRMVVFAVAEDAYETVLKPRLLAAGANLEHVLALGWVRAGTEDALLIPDDVPVLAQHLTAMTVRLLVIDPLLSHFSRKTNTHIDHEVKLGLKPLMALAHSTGCTVLGNGHFSKDRTGGARRAASGSTAFTNTPRVGMAMAYDDEDPDLRVLEVVKSNVGPKGVGRNYRIKTVEVAGLNEPVPILVAEGAATKAVDDLIAAQTRGKRVPSELVRALILAELENGEQARGHLDAVAEEKLGANSDSVYKYGLAPLRKAGTVSARKDGTTGGWYWRLAREGGLG
jgi:AAA domain